MNVDGENSTKIRVFLRNDAFESFAAPFVQAGVLREEDLAIIDAVAPRWGVVSKEVLLAFALALRAPRQGHVGVDLLTVKDTVVGENEGRMRPGSKGQETADEPGIIADLPWPEEKTWQQQVLASRMVGRLDDQKRRPFVSQQVTESLTLVMTRRMASEQRRVAEGLKRLARAKPAFVPIEGEVRKHVRVLFGETESEGARAARKVSERALTLITGGPGTGKTYSVKRTLATLLATNQMSPHPPLRIMLAAPTGKAGVRMQEAMMEDLDELGVEEPVREKLRKLTASTLHGLLGVRPDGSVRHDAGNPIPADVIVVDEASMIDLVLMRMLVEAVADGARLVLLGDPDQLASVEAGTVLGDMVATAREHAGGLLHDAHVHFRENHRSKDAPSISEIAARIQGGTSDGLKAALDELVEPKKSKDIRYVKLDADVDGVESSGAWDQVMDGMVAPYLQGPGEESDKARGTGYVHVLLGILTEGEKSGRDTKRWNDAKRRRVLDALGSYRVLAVHRRGRRGVSGLNRELGKRVREKIRERTGVKNVKQQAGYWLGEIVLVTRNARDLGLQNGDVGVVLPSDDGHLAAYFPKEQAKVNQIALGRLPEPEPGFAMTVHKSQGSQFERVAVVLAAKPSALQTRELVYTAITRAKRKIDWYGDADVMREALGRPIKRASGLGAMLGEGD